MHSLIESFFAQRDLVYSYRESFDCFIETAKNLLRSCEPFQSETSTFRIGNVTCLPPKMTPQEARLRNLNYNLGIVADIIETTKDKKIIMHPAKPICEIPCMLGSKMCHMFQRSKDELIELGECTEDIGGYYIQNGKEKVLIAQERADNNRVFCWPPQKTKEKSYRMICEVRSSITLGEKPFILKLAMTQSRSVVVIIPGLRETIPFGSLVFAMGHVRGVSIKMEDIFEWTLAPQSEVRKALEGSEFSPNVIETMKILAIVKVTVDSAVVKERLIESILKTDILLHIRSELRMMFLCEMLRKLLDTAAKRSKSDDRDSFVNKRIEIDGKLFETIFRGSLEKYVEEVKKGLQKQGNVSAFSRETFITTNIERCMSKGDWGVSKLGYKKQGVSQAMVRHNWMSAVSNIRRISSNRSMESRSLVIRQLHGSQWGICDPAETPDGKVSGILKNTSLCSFTTTETSEAVVMQFLEDSKFIEPATPTLSKIILNGKWVGSTPSPKKLLEYVRANRSNIHPETSFSFVSGNVLIFCDSGRSARPLIVVRNGRMDINGTFEELLRRGSIQMVDTMEEQTSLVAMTPKDITPKSHFCEISPVLILGLSSSIIPWPDSNQGPRNSYSGNMTKQSIGIPMMNVLERFDPVNYFMFNAEKPIVGTFISKFLPVDILPTGINCVAAIIAKGWNIEDSVILNQAAVDRGLFTRIIFKTYVAEEFGKENKQTKIIEGVPKGEPLSTLHRNFMKLDANGIIKERSGKGSMPVQDGDVLVRRVLKKSDGTTSDLSVVYQGDEKGFVDRVLIVRNKNGHRVVKVRLGFYRIPIIGDKFASLHAQKGTCGMILPPEDMPFTSSGIVPDIVINPHAFPSRMTISHLIECITGKVTLLTGKSFDASPFSESKNGTLDHLNEMKSLLTKEGFQPEGEESLTSGTTGELLDGTVFIGPTYYRSLKHMIWDKLSARSTGKMEGYTRQPANLGRKDGISHTSLKFGKMEKDAYISHGAPSSIRDRLLICSDAFHTTVCECGQFTCTCNTQKTDIVTPYVFKLVAQNATSLMIKMNLVPQKDI